MVIPGITIRVLDGGDVSTYVSPHNREFSVLDRDASGKIIVRRAHSKYVPEVSIDFPGDFDEFEKNIAYLVNLYGVTHINERTMYKLIYPGGSTVQMYASFIVD